MPNGEILRFEDGVKKRLARNFVAPIRSWYNFSAENTQTFHELALRDPNLAVQQLPEFIERARNSAGPGTKGYEAYVGGANHDWTGPLIDVVGTVYPVLDADIRRQALSNIFGFLDQQNYFAAQDNVALVNEPWLVGDILANRSLYWCGYKEYVEMIEKYPAWKDLFPHLGEVKSAFWMTLAVSQPRFASDEIRRNYASVFPTLVDRTQDAIAGLIAVRAENDFIQNGVPIDEGIQARLFKEAHAWAPAIKRKIGERKWVDLDEAVYLGKPKEGEPDRGYWAYRSAIPNLLSAEMTKEDSKTLDKLRQTRNANSRVQQMIRFAILEKNKSAGENGQFFVIVKSNGGLYVSAGAPTIQGTRDIMEKLINEEIEDAGWYSDKREIARKYKVYSKDGILIPANS